MLADIVSARVRPDRSHDRDSCILLPSVSWSTYESLLCDLKDSHAAHLAYDRGMLEIMVLSGKHELPKDLLVLLVNVIAEERGIDIKGFGSTTFRRADLARGFEPDACFYIQNEERVSEREDLDLATDPPPDLVIEIDIANPSLSKFPIFSALGIPEIWRYDGKLATIFALAGETYRECSESTAFKGVTNSMLSEFVEAGKHTKRTAWLRNLRMWARAPSA